MPDKRSVVVIVGGGFGGLAAARALKRAPVKVVLIDRVNHYLFQPLLYQVATSVLAPGQIASPIRSILRRSRNTTVVLGTVTGVDAATRQVVVETQDRTGVPLSYDYLILATGQTHSYFGHNEYEKYAPGLKNLADAVAIRNKILTAFGCLISAYRRYKITPRLESLARIILFPLSIYSGQMDGALALDESHHQRHGILRWDREHHVDMIGQKIPFFGATLLLLGQFAKHLVQVLAKVPVQHLPATFGDKNNVVLALPLRVA